MSKRVPRIAIVKSNFYQDLWVTDKTSDPLTLFKSSMMRCPPIGLAELYSAEFIIVRLLDEYPCTETIAELPAEHLATLTQSKKGKNPTLPFLHEEYHGDLSLESVAHHPDSIDWSQYDIILTINACIPARITSKFPKTLWCYWIGENNGPNIETCLQGYNVILNQDVTFPLNSVSVGFPYTFLGPNTLETLFSSGSERTGVFMEINNTTERPVVKIPEEFQKIERETGHAILRHNQDILKNADALCKAKYFVKIMGRGIRGNSLIEAISAGVLILVNTELVRYKNLCIPMCHIVNEHDAIEKIKYFDENPEEYATIIAWQKEYLRIHYQEKPMEKIIQCWKTLTP